MMLISQHPVFNFILIVYFKIVPLHKVRSLAFKQLTGFLTARIISRHRSSTRFQSFQPRTSTNSGSITSAVDPHQQINTHIN